MIVDDISHKSVIIVARMKINFNETFALQKQKEIQLTQKNLLK